MLEIGGKNIVIDAGPDFRCQMLRAGVKDIRAILLTHEHKDHIGGLDDVRAFNWVKKGPVAVYADHLTKAALMKDYAYAFKRHTYPGVPKFDLHLLTSHPFYIDEVKIIPIPVMHYKLPVMGFRIGNFAYITDASYIPDSSMALLEGTEYLVVNALRKEPHMSHFTLSEAVVVAQRLGVRQAWLTHIGHQMGLAAEVDKELPDNIRLAHDTLEVEL